MKILMATSRFHPFTGGVEKHVLMVSKELVKMGHEVSVLTFTNGQNLATKDLVEQIPTFRVRVDGMGKRAQLYCGLWAVRNSKLVSTLDVIHGHDLYSPLLKRLARKAKYHFTFHGYEGYPVKQEAIRRRKEVEQSVSGTICAGAFIEKWYSQRCDIVEWGAADLPPRNEPIAMESDLCFVGRLQTDTGIRAYLEALAKIKLGGVSLKMVVCGNGELEGELKDFARTNELNVHFTGQVTNPGEYIAGTKVACVSGFLAILEAFMRRKSVAAYYDTPIKKDYLRMAPYSKDIAIASNSSSLAQEIQKLLAEQNSGNSKIEKNYRFALGQTWENMAKLYLKLYDESH